ncbi:MAG: ABC transporter substrate-binding protein [Lachnospiraceae bacterium]|nr:ABC transporter substrate-binding protein [Lachnospiraceae bacterium]
MKKRQFLKFRLLLPVIGILGGLFCTVGCGTSQNTVETGNLIRSDAPKHNSDYITVGFIQTGKESDWRDANTNDYWDTFTTENGYNLIYVDGNSDSNRQVKAAYDLIAQKVDYLIIDPIVEDGWDDVLTLAQQENIPVIISDRGVNANPSLYECWIGSDFKTEGINAAKWLYSYLEKNGREKENLNIVILEGTAGASAAIGRTEGLLEEISKHSNWNILTSQCANFTQGEGTNVMKQILTDYPHEDIDVVISENDNMMFGAMKAMEQAGMRYGVDTDVITISFDALYEAFELMQEGKLMVSVECNPLIAGLSHQVIQDLEAGKTVDSVYYVEESVFTYENAAEYISDRKY